jgi:multidrug efflux system outer membrane protein
VSVFGGGGVTQRGSTELNQKLFNFGAVTAWQLDLFGKLRDMTRAAQEQYFAARQARDEAQLVLVDEIATDYLTLRDDQALLGIARATLASGQASLDLTKHRLDAGVASALDVTQAQTIAEQARFDVARLTTQVAQDRNALELVVGAPVAGADLPGDLDGEVVVLGNLPGAVSSRVLLTRPDVVQAEDALKAANANIGAARASFFPQISLTASGGLTSLALSSLFKGAAATWSFAPALTQPIFEGGANLAGLELAKGQRDLAVAQYEKVIQTAFREVADALAQRGTIEEQVAAQAALSEAARQALTLAQARYQRGADSYLNVLIAQRTYYAAQQTLVTARLAKSLNLVTLYGVLGGGLDSPRA